MDKHISKLIFFTVFLTISQLKAQTYNEILCRPEDSSMTVSVMFYSAVDLYIEYGTQPGIYTNANASISNTAGVPDKIKIDNLIPDTKYYYRTRYRSAGTSNFLAGPERTFHTQRALGSTFTFTIEADPHLYDKKGCTNLYNICLTNQAADQPDFMIDMGDTYGDDHYPDLMTSGQSDSLHRYYRPLLGQICHSVPFCFCIGNHEGECNYYLNQTPPDNIAVWGTLWRKLYFPNPEPDNFYSGNTEVEGYGMGHPENYYAWEWGNALFVVLDAYRYQCDTSAKPRKWNWTLGLTQYNWLKNVLENSTQQYKFVFIHQLMGQVRGGILQAPYYEWGGYEQNGTTYGFDSKRPGWGKPIHRLLVDNGVNILFHGHDHLFSHEVLDSVVYQEVPMPSDSTYEIGMLANADAYASDTIDGSGHVRVTVSPSCVKVDYVKVYMPADTVSGLHHNREVAFSYTLGTCQTSINNKHEGEGLKIFPNPADQVLNVIFDDKNDLAAKVIVLFDANGRIVKETSAGSLSTKDLPSGIYVLSIKSNSTSIYKKVIVQH